MYPRRQQLLFTPSTPCKPETNNIDTNLYNISWNAASGAKKYQVQRWSAWQNYSLTTAISVIIQQPLEVPLIIRLFKPACYAPTVLLPNTHKTNTY